MAVSASMLRGNCNVVPIWFEITRNPIVVEGTSGAPWGYVPETPDLIGRAQRYAAAAFAFYERFPFSSKGWYAADQFYRASSSATSNYCAAKRGRSTAEFIAKLGTVVEEIDEAVRWLEHMRDARIAIDPEKPSNYAGSGARRSAPPAAMNEQGNRAQGRTSQTATPERIEAAPISGSGLKVPRSVDL